MESRSTRRTAPSHAVGAATAERCSEAAAAERRPRLGEAAAARRSALEAAASERSPTVEAAPGAAPIVRRSPLEAAPVVCRSAPVVRRSPLEAAPVVCRFPLEAAPVVRRFPLEAAPVVCRFPLEAAPAVRRAMLLAVPSSAAIVSESFDRVSCGASLLPQGGFARAAGSSSLIAARTQASPHDVELEARLSRAAMPLRGPPAGDPPLPPRPNRTAHDRLHERRSAHLRPTQQGASPPEASTSNATRACASRLRRAIGRRRPVRLRGPRVTSRSSSCARSAGRGPCSADRGGQELGRTKTRPGIVSVAASGSLDSTRPRRRSTKKAVVVFNDRLGRRQSPGPISPGAGGVRPQPARGPGHAHGGGTASRACADSRRASPARARLSASGLVRRAPLRRSPASVSPASRGHLRSSPSAAAALGSKVPSAANRGRRPRPGRGGRSRVLRPPPLGRSRRGQSRSQAQQTEGRPRFQRRRVDGAASSSVFPLSPRNAEEARPA